MSELCRPPAPESVQRQQEQKNGERFSGKQETRIEASDAKDENEIDGQNESPGAERRAVRPEECNNDSSHEENAEHRRTILRHCETFVRVYAGSRLQQAHPPFGDYPIVGDR